MGAAGKIAKYTIAGITLPIWGPALAAASIRFAYNERDTVYSGNLADYSTKFWFTVPDMRSCIMRATVREQRVSNLAIYSANTCGKESAAQQRFGDFDNAIHIEDFALEGSGKQVTDFLRDEVCAPIYKFLIPEQQRLENVTPYVKHKKRTVRQTGGQKREINRFILHTGSAVFMWPDNFARTYIIDIAEKI